MDGKSSIAANLLGNEDHYYGSRDRLLMIELQFVTIAIVFNFDIIDCGALLGFWTTAN